MNTLYSDWPDGAQHIARVLEPLLTRGGASYYRLSKGAQIRVGWTGDDRTVLLGTLNPRREGVLLTLRVGAQSRFLQPEGPLQLDPRHRDSGRFKLCSPDVPPDFPSWVNDALRCVALRLEHTIHHSRLTTELQSECSDAVRVAAARAGWRFPLQCTHPALDVFVEGRHSFYSVLLESKAEPAMLTCRITGVAPIRRRRRAVAEAVLRANGTLPFGSFQYDTSSGDIHYYSGLPLHDCSAGVEALELQAFFGISQLDEYLPVLREVSGGTRDPRSIGTDED